MRYIQNHARVTTAHPPSTSHVFDRPEDDTLPSRVDDPVRREKLAAVVDGRGSYEDMSGEREDGNKARQCTRVLHDEEAKDSTERTFEKIGTLLEKRFLCFERVGEVQGVLPELSRHLGVRRRPRTQSVSTDRSSRPASA